MFFEDPLRLSIPFKEMQTHGILNALQEQQMLTMKVSYLKCPLGTTNVDHESKLQGLCSFTEY